MKILIVGAAGKLGAAITQEAVGRGLEVTGLVRDRNKAAVLPQPASLVEGDGRDPQAIERAINGQDVVIVPAGGLKEPVTAEIVEALLPAMTKAAVKRLVVISAYGAVDPTGFYGWLINAASKPVVKDKTRTEELLRQSTTDWTAIRPGILTDGPKSGRARSGAGTRLKGLPRISRADVAKLVIDEVVTPAFVKQAIVAYVEGQQV